MITFDKLAFVDSLTKSGIPEDQARAQADALDTALHETVATRHDIELVQNDIKLVRSEMREMEQRIVIRLGGMMIIAVGAVATLVKLL